MVTLMQYLPETLNFKLWLIKNYSIVIINIGQKITITLTLNSESFSIFYPQGKTYLRPFELYFQLNLLVGSNLIER
jgi:hypothetical protein